MQDRVDEAEVVRHDTDKVAVGLRDRTSAHVVCREILDEHVLRVLLGQPLDGFKGLWPKDGLAGAPPNAVELFERKDPLWLDEALLPGRVTRQEVTLHLQVELGRRGAGPGEEVERFGPQYLARFALDAGVRGVELGGADDGRLERVGVHMQTDLHLAVLAAVMGVAWALKKGLERAPAFADGRRDFGLGSVGIGTDGQRLEPDIVALENNRGA